MIWLKFSDIIFDILVAFFCGMCAMYIIENWNGSEKDVTKKW